MTLPDIFQDQEAPFDMYETAGLNARHIAAKALEAMGKDDAAAERVAAALIAG